METMSRAKNPKYESMSLEELKANMEKEQKGTGAGNSQDVGEDTERVGRHQKGTFPEPECAEYRRKTGCTVTAVERGYQRVCGH